MPVKPISVSRLNAYINRVLSTDPILMDICVSGEVSNLTRHSAGHWYFALKDESSRINCFLARDRVQGLRYEISEGMEITACGNVSVYERGGYYSLQVRDVEVQGEGSLKAAFENLKKKLQSEGLFDEGRKRALPLHPRRIGVISSPTGAAVRDIISTVRRRNPLVDILIYPCTVQGPEAAESIEKAFREMNLLFSDLDLIIAGRGGGSAEDLWCFNEERVARAFLGSEIPVISAVGHEVDWVISDYVADMRAATPTAAAELAVPHIAAAAGNIELYSPCRLYSRLMDVVETAQLKLDRIKQKLDSSAACRLEGAARKLELIKMDIDLSGPAALLDKGYAVVQGECGRRLASCRDARGGDMIKVIFKDGSLRCRVQEVEAVNG